MSSFRRVLKYFRICCLFCFAMLIELQPALCQKIKEDLLREMAKEGYKNIRIKRTNKLWVIGFDDYAFRWDVEGINHLMELLSNKVAVNDSIHLILSLNDIPQISVKALLQEQLDGKYWSGIEVSRAEQASWKSIRQEAKEAPSTWKFDIIPYPQFALRNTKFHQLYEIQLNIAPAIIFSPWKGNQIIAQCIFPIHNDLEREGDFIRPGYLVMQQHFRPFERWTVNAAIGHFNNDRYGGHLQVEHYFKHPAFSASAEMQYTGYMAFYKDYYLSSPIGRLTWKVAAQYFWSKYNLRFDLAYQKYIFTDEGPRFDVTRYFRDTSIGFYATLINDKLNGGFHFAIPIGPGKRSKQRRINFRLPAYFDWEYNARTDFRNGSYIETSPDQNRSKDYLNPLYIQTQLKK